MDKMSLGAIGHNGWIHLPSLVKVGGFLGFWLIIWLPWAIPLAKRSQWQPFAPLTPQQKLPLLGSLYVMAPLLWGLLFWIEGSNLADYGLVWNLALGQSLIWGMAIAISSLIAIFGLEGVLGGVQGQFSNVSRLPALLLPLLVLGLTVGLIEEVIFRGIFFTQLQVDYPPLIAAALSSAIFALLHLVWERQLTLPQIPGLWLMGMVLVWARWNDGGSLGLAWGLHAGWIWGLSVLDASELLSYSGRSPAWLTGIGQQPLAGVMGLLCLVLTGLVVGQLPSWGWL
jgi:membrane protease YdiL (CAAX protease family)